jgi:molybdopterin molybdotransferase
MARVMMVEPDRRQRIARLTPLADVLARLDALVRPVAPRTAELAAALGQTLVEDVIIHAPVPATALALRDGWAVSSDLTTDASAYAPAPLPSAVWVDVGQPLPGDADAVAPIDGVVIRDGAAQALAPVGPGEGALPTGADVARGTTLLPAGRRLGRIEIALLAAAGVAQTHVRAPRLHLVHAAPGGVVIDAAIACIADAIASQGGLAAIAARHSLADALAETSADAVVVVGGTGSGKNDTTVHTLTSIGELLVHGIGLLPGETTAFGTVGTRPVLALPGRLDAALAAWHMLGRAMLARLAGSRDAPPMRTAKLTHKVSSPVGLSELVPVRCEGPCATPIASGYVPLAALAQANGWIFIKPDSEGYPAQSEVVIRPWP